MIGNDGEMLGVFSIQSALLKAREENLDLVEISPHLIPPVCKVMDYGKHCYTQQKKMNEAKKKQKVVHIKEIKMKLNIADGDYQVKLRQCQKFLSDGDKVKVSLMFKGREITHKELGFKLMNKFISDVNQIAKIDSAPKLEGKNIGMMLSQL